MIHANEYPTYLKKLADVKGKLPSRYTGILLKRLADKGITSSIFRVRNAMSGLHPDWHILQAATEIAEIEREITLLNEKTEQLRKNLVA